MASISTSVEEVIVDVGVVGLAAKLKDTSTFNLLGSYVRFLVASV